MSHGNVAAELENGKPFPVPSTTPVKVINVYNKSHGSVCVFGYVNGDPGTYAVASQGYTGDFAKGCILVDTSNGKPYSNKSSISAPDWTVLS